MKKLLTTLCLIFIFSSYVLAKDSSYTACTTDGKAVSLKLSLVDTVSEKIEAEIQKAFRDTAKEMTAEQLLTSDGFIAFADRLSDEDVDAIGSIPGPPVVFGECK